MTVPDLLKSLVPPRVDNYHVVPTMGFLLQLDEAASMREDRQSLALRGRSSLQAGKTIMNMWYG